MKCVQGFVVSNDALEEHVIEIKNTLVIDISILKQHESTYQEILYTG